MNYYDVHCTSCGKVFPADRMAVDIDKLIQVHLQKFSVKSSDDFYRKAKEVFDEIKTGICMTKYDLINRGYLAADDVLEMTGNDVIHFIEEKAQIVLPERMPRSAQPVQAQDSFWEEFDKPETKEQETADVEEIIDTLSFKLEFYNQNDADESGKREKLKELLRLLTENRNKVLLRCTCCFKFQQDDQGREFLSSLEVVYIDGEHKNYGNMVCPYCGGKLLTDSGKYEEKIIVMLGSSRVGKTAYLAALVDMHVNRKSENNTPINMGSVAGAQYENFRKNILEPYAKGEKIVKTDISKDKVALVPMQITLNGKTVNYIFVDLPGEVFVPSSEQEKEAGAASGDFIANHRRICEYADAFWLCIAPMQIDYRLKGMNEKLGKSDKVEMDMDMILANISNIISLMGTAKSKTPTAVVLTMSDLIDRSEALYSATEEPGRDCLTDAMMFRTDLSGDIALRVKQYLQSGNMNINIIPRLDRIFEFKSYFSVAAYGKTVSDETAESDKAPCGIDLPFLWTAACMGLLRPVKLVQRVEHTGFLHRRENVVEDLADAEMKDLFV